MVIVMTVEQSAVFLFVFYSYLYARGVIVYYTYISLYS